MKVSISVSETLIRKALSSTNSNKNLNAVIYLYRLTEKEIERLPIVSIAKEEWTKMKVEQLASTLATSAVAMALAVMESPGHPYPYRDIIEIGNLHSHTQ